jgi:hypothetical protein
VKLCHDKLTLGTILAFRKACKPGSARIPLQTGVPLGLPFPTAPFEHLASESLAEKELKFLEETKQW